MQSSYDKFLIEFNAYTDPWKCVKCGGDVDLYGDKHSKLPSREMSIRQFCFKEKIGRLWRNTELTLMNKDHARYIREQGLLPITDAAEVIGVTQTYLRDRIGRRLIPFVSVGGRVFIEKSRIEDIKLYFMRIKRRSPGRPRIRRLPNAQGTTASNGGVLEAAKAALKATEEPAPERPITGDGTGK